MKNLKNHLKKIGIVGAGKMGLDIFYELLEAGYYIVLFDIAFLSGERKIDIENKFQKKVGRLLKNGIIKESRLLEIQQEVVITQNIEDLKDCDLIIEAIVENKDVKKQLFNRLDNIVKKGSIFVSNSSSILPEKIFSEVSRKDKTAGLHFFYPVKITNIVEIIKSNDTSSSTTEQLKMLVKSLNKQYLLLKRDNAFILNKVLINFHTQCFRYHIENGIGIKEIDNIVKRNIFPIGTFEFYDSVGLDTMLQSLKEYIETIPHKEWVRPMLILVEEYVKRGFYGNKNGGGFYVSGIVNENVVLHRLSNQNNPVEEKEIVETLISLYINTIFSFIEKGFCTAEEINYAIKEYMRLDKGPIEFAKEFGIDKIRAILLKNYKKTGHEVFKPVKGL